MAIASTFPFKLPLSPPQLKVSQPNASFQFKLIPPVITANLKSRNRNFSIKAVEESKESDAIEKAEESSENGASSSNASEIGEEIKKAMMERKAKEGEENGGLLSGIAEEIQEIEWPAFGKVVGTTGVVLGVIAGSSVVLLTVNFILAELSDRVFSGRGVQDFFG